MVFNQGPSKPLMKLYFLENPLKLIIDHPDMYFINVKLEKERHQNISELI